jgi:hypothetical protein
MKGLAPMLEELAVTRITPMEFIASPALISRPVCLRGPGEICASYLMGMCKAVNP